MGLKTAKLSKVIITGSKDRLRDAVSVLHEKNAIHIKDFTEEKGGLRIGEALPEATALSKRILRVKSIISSLDIEGFALSKKEAVSNVEKWLDSTLDKADEEVTSLFKKKTSTESRLDELRREKELLAQLDSLPDSLRLDVSSVTVFTGFMKMSPSEALGKLFNECKVESAKEHKKWTTVIHCPLAHEARVKELLEIADFEYMDIPRFEGTLAQAKKANTDEHAKLEKGLAKVEEGITKSREEYGNFLLASEEHLANKLDIAEMPLHCATTNEFFIMEGWVPSNRVEEVTISVDKATDSHVTVEEVESTDDDAPVLMKNRGPPRQFQPLIDAYSNPKAKEVDPTFLVAIFFPIFFGFMLGDVAYGIIVLCMVLGGITDKMFRMFAMDSVGPQLNRILKWSSVSTIIFGFFYGEFFGFELYNYHGEAGLLSQWGIVEIEYSQYALVEILYGMEIVFPLHRVHEIELMLVLTCLIGIFHLYIAWFLGFRNVAVLHGVKDAIFEKGGWIIALTGAWVLSIYVVPIMMRGWAMPNTTNIIYISIALIVVGMIMVIKAEGATGLIELPTMWLSNTLSYTRLFAIGASSAGIAIAFNNMALAQWEIGGGKGIAMAALIFFMGHFINIILGLIGPTLHSLRLHYVEFFTKFYEGGGNRYTPFGKRRKCTIEH
ncbi:MAG: V-type ATP synthase subunit I [Thermoplasmata archaeon]|nr:V-type ATP synthase subunit I [Thermoplasmata archaeon]